MSEAPKQPAASYKDSINLPVTDFAMKANLPVREKEILARWEAMDLYGRIQAQSKGKKKFVLHDGPPFANGDIHLGHALNKILKDIVVRHRTMKGFDSPYVPGWDCHGLPIEHKVSVELGSAETNPVTIRKRCAEYAQKYIGIQREQFRRLGILGDWMKPYLTMDPAYEADILRNFAVLVEKGLVYQSLRPVFWSTGCQTALAEAEIEYEDRTDISVYVKCSLIPDSPNKPKNFTSATAQGGRKIYFLIWTTTPWTLPANLAIAVNAGLEYGLVKAGDEYWILALSRLADIERISNRKLEIISQTFGADMEGMRYLHPLLKREGQIITAQFVTAENGTGLVHIAPGHGHDDYVVGQKYGLPLLSPVDDRGCLTADCGLPEIMGQYVFKANKPITELLRAKGALVAEESITHSYPHCWRSKTPIIFRSVKQWFIKVDAFRADALKAIDTVHWVPDWGINRIRGSVETRHDWCISRQRTWGVPIPVFYKAGGEAVLDAKVVKTFADIVEKEGTDVWFRSSAPEMAKRLGLSENLAKGSDTLDVWIDSGSSFRAVAKKQLVYPSDLYLEGSDQHRGWFQSSLLLAVATGEGAPYRAVLTHGFVVDGDGRKMSKSLGNVISPQDVIQQLGADILRLWTASSLYADDIRVSKDIFDRLSDSYRKFRNTFKYLLGNLAGFDPAKDRVKHEEMPEIDRWALSKLAGLIREAEETYDGYQYHRFYQSVYNFCVRELSSFYFDVLKDRLYADARGSLSGRSARTVLFEIFTGLTKLLAPVLAYTCDEAWGYLQPFPGKTESIHLEKWPEDTRKWRNEALETKWERLMGIREKVLKALEERREKKEIGNSLEAGVELSVSNAEEHAFLESAREELASVFLVSSVVVKKSDAGFEAIVSRASGAKCARCWNWRPEVGSDKTFADLCRRCSGVVKGESK